ncbi:MAG TPA: GNAT family N-acetyltransferase [Kofleriaceae bacterium]|jgi:ribosomal protein S18 acetylase RimI-like enzyme|nr:GNAT family N-acetyltransferase [Kofleriaceae bacterium]
MTMANYGFVIAIREIGPDDWEQFRGIRLRALAEAPHAFSSTYSGWQHAVEARWRSRLADVAYNTLAVDGGIAVGMVSAVDGDPVELISLWVAPDARGRGVGDLLVRTVLGYAGARPTRLNVYPDNAPAIALYRRHGFAELGVVEGELQMEHAR